MKRGSDISAIQQLGLVGTKEQKCNVVRLTILLYHFLKKSLGVKKMSKWV